MPDVPGARAGHGRRQLRGDVLQGALAARRALLLNGRHQRPPHAHGVGAQGQSFKDVHAVLKGAVHKDGDFPPQGFHNLRQDQQRRHRGGHDPVVVGDQNPARPGVQTLLGVLGAEHPP